MRHETTKRTRLENAPRHAAEDPFTQPAVTVRAGHQQVGSLVQGKLEQMIRVRSVTMKNWSRIGIDPVPRQIADHVINPG
jgi:hypothetical protein